MSRFVWIVNTSCDPVLSATVELITTGDGEVVIEDLYVFEPPEKDYDEETKPQREAP